jgi:hypothetical protein
MRIKLALQVTRGLTGFFIDINTSQINWGGAGVQLGETINLKLKVCSLTISPSISLSVMKVNCANARPYLKLKTQSRIHPVSLSLSMVGLLWLKRRPVDEITWHHFFAANMSETREQFQISFSVKKEFRNVI